MLELNCETDFVAKNEDFLGLAKRIAMHVAWAAPQYLNGDEVPTNIVEQEKEIYRSQLTPQQEKIAERILDGRIQKFYEENCLLSQIDAQEVGGKSSVQDVINQVSVALGEKIELRRFLRFEVGEGIEKKEVNYAEEVAQAANV